MTDEAGGGGDGGNLPVKPNRKGGFQKGNKASVGNRGKAAPNSIYRHRKFLSRALISMLNEKDEKSKKKVYEQILSSWIEKAKEGDTPTINSMMDRIEGKPAQVLETDGFDEYEAVRVEHVIIRPRGND